MPCSHCHQTGHNIRTCPQRAVTDTTPTSPVSRETARPSVEIRAHREPVARGTHGNFVTEIILENRNNYEVDIYLRRDFDPESQGLYTFAYTFESYDQGSILIVNSDTSIIAVPKSSRTDMFPLAGPLDFSDLLLSTFPMGYYFTDEGHVDLERVHQFNDGMEASICVVTREGLGFVIDKYVPHYYRDSRNIDQWKRYGLKSMYLLQQIIKLGGMNYDNLAPILDMVQDIETPAHSEADKERAGIPSTLTNVS